MFRHFARHSKGSPQAWQTFGANPFLVLATRAVLLTPAFYRPPPLDEPAPNSGRGRARPRGPRPYAGDVSPTGTIELVYDGDCGLCRASVDWLRRRDEGECITALPSSSCTWDDVDPALFVTTVVARTDDGIVTASTAAATALSVLPGGWGSLGRLALRVSTVPLARRVADGCYYLVARNRIAISKLLVRCRLIDASCAVPAR